MTRSLNKAVVIFFLIPTPTDDFLSVFSYVTANLMNPLLFFSAPKRTKRRKCSISFLSGVIRKEESLPVGCVSFHTAR